MHCRRCYSDRGHFDRETRRCLRGSLRLWRSSGGLVLRIPSHHSGWRGGLHSPECLLCMWFIDSVYFVALRIHGQPRIASQARYRAARIDAIHSNLNRRGEDRNIGWLCQSRELGNQRIIPRLCCAFLSGTIFSGKWPRWVFSGIVVRLAHTVGSQRLYSLSKLCDLPSTLI